MVQPCSITVNTATSTPVRHARHSSLRGKPRCAHCLFRKVTSTKSGNRLGNKSSMPKFGTHITQYSRGRGKKLHELYASKSHHTCFMERDANLKVHLESYTTISKSTDSSMMRYSSIRANCNVHEDDIENDIDDADNDGNDDASFSKNDTRSCLEDKDFHNPQRAYNFNRALGEPELATKITQNMFFNDDMDVYHEHKANARNYANKAYYKKDRFHRTGSKLYRQVAGELKRVQRLKISHLFFNCSLKLTKRVLIEAKNKRLQNRVESIETEMMKIKDLVFQQFNIVHHLLYVMDIKLQILEDAGSFKF
ncbi:LOW QUALITY PROTEIN: hypothetical protein Cgig2_000223 [Carnegiea gigantea]|uniref:Uncharacterized protein n=1 Tax=Carnegiea gigantea TaxID=171969 RepID=A0A9Q1Q4X0_9CARY|nr:LOW QUALITY PROTEIN: hypothetical protein Cgig2_000223 [Carnegiea gigantea]